MTFKGVLSMCPRNKNALICRIRDVLGWTKGKLRGKSASQDVGGRMMRFSYPVSYAVMSNQGCRVNGVQIAHPEWDKVHPTSDNRYENGIR